MTKLLRGDEAEPGVFSLKEATQHVNTNPKISKLEGGWGDANAEAMLKKKLAECRASIHRKKKHSS